MYYSAAWGDELQLTDFFKALLHLEFQQISQRPTVVALTTKERKECNRYFLLTSLYHY